MLAQKVVGVHVKPAVIGTYGFKRGDAAFKAELGDPSRFL